MPRIPRPDVTACEGQPRCLGWKTRPCDGYVDARALCRQHGKSWRAWIDADGRGPSSPYSYPTRQLLTTFAVGLDLPAKELIREEHGEIWLHPGFAETLATWTCLAYCMKVSIAFANLLQRSPSIRRAFGEVLGVNFVEVEDDDAP
jgi:hypothetical protein